ncbi:MAG: hypothetical protein ABII16_02965 [Patescibacteria group bacterium]
MRDGGVNHRKILYSYPKLRKEIATANDGKSQEITFDFVDCGWDSSFEFFAIPTFLPFSPFGKNHFYFSIYNEIIGGKENGRRVDRIAIHELSHICWYQKIELAHKELGFKLNSATNYYLKEAFATIIGECEEFLKVNSGFSPTNYNTSLLRVNSDGEEIGFVDFFRRFFNKEREKGFGFDTILRGVLKIGCGIQGELDKKWSLWNKYGDDLDKLSKSGYQSPVVITCKTMGFDGKRQKSA